MRHIVQTISNIMIYTEIINGLGKFLCIYLTNLFISEPGVPYNISITATNEFGVGEVSKATVFTKSESKLFYLTLLNLLSISFTFFNCMCVSEH